MEAASGREKQLCNLLLEGKDCLVMEKNGLHLFPKSLGFMLKVIPVRLTDHWKNMFDMTLFSNLEASPVIVNKAGFFFHFLFYFFYSFCYH